MGVRHIMKWDDKEWLYVNKYCVACGEKGLWSDGANHICTECGIIFELDDSEAFPYEGDDQSDLLFERLLEAKEDIKGAICD